MAKRVVPTEGMNITSIVGMVSTLGRLLGDEVYVNKVIEVESSEAVIKALDAILNGMKEKQIRATKKTPEQ